MDASERTRCTGDDTTRSREYEQSAADAAKAGTAPDAGATVSILFCYLTTENVRRLLFSSSTRESLAL